MVGRKELYRVFQAHARMNLVREVDEETSSMLGSARSRGTWFSAAACKSGERQSRLSRHCAANTGSSAGSDMIRWRSTLQDLPTLVGIVNVYTAWCGNLQACWACRLNKILPQFGNVAVDLKHAGCLSSMCLAGELTLKAPKGAAAVFSYWR